MNPILPGFHPDPSILRVGAEYFIATSTFEWHPGVRLSHSRDLVNWRPVGHVLQGDALADLRGVDDSAGIWAPSLSWSDGHFWLVFTVVVNARGTFKDLTNYLTTAPSIDGPWSEPVPLNASGFDPSLFHDQDGRRWLANVRWDSRPGHPAFAGIVVQEYDHEQRGLVGPATTVLRKEVLIEGPNLYRRDGWYYLMLAEGGTGWEHGISMARSRSLLGPYELDPQPAVLTSRQDPGRPLQKAGHGELVETPEDGWFLVHLASRPLQTPEGRYCILGRETCLQRVHWNEAGWLRATQGDEALVEVPAPEHLPPAPWPVPATTDDFDAPELGPDWATLRGPLESPWLDLAERPGWLRLRGQQSLSSRHRQTLVAQRLTSMHCVASTVLQFSPSTPNQAAGMIAWYGTEQNYYLQVSGDETLGPCVSILATDDGVTTYAAPPSTPVGDWALIHLRAIFDGPELSFAVSPDGRIWTTVGPSLPAWKLSDDYGSHLRFTGAFTGICVQDLDGHAAVADFGHFTLRPLG